MPPKPKTPKPKTAAEKLAAAKAATFERRSADLGKAAATFVERQREFTSACVDSIGADVVKPARLALGRCNSARAKLAVSLSLFLASQGREKTTPVVVGGWFFRLKAGEAGRPVLDKYINVQPVLGEACAWLFMSPSASVRDAAIVTVDHSPVEDGQ